MKRLVCWVFAALIVFVEWIPAQSQSPQPPRGPLTQLFDATDLAGNPIPTHFYLTGGGSFGRLAGAVGQETLDWFGDFAGSGAERDWAGHRLDSFGYSATFILQGDLTCDGSMDAVTPWPVNIPGSQARCWLLPVFPGNSVSGAIAPLSVTSAGVSLVFHDWEVVDPEPGRCRTGNMGIRVMPDSENIRGTIAPFDEGVEYRVRGVSEDESASAAFRAVYAPASPDISAPLITVDSPRDCWEIPHGAAATVAFSCRDLGDPLASCSATPGYENGAAIDTSVSGDFSFDVTATDHAGNTRTRTVRYSVVDVTAPIASPTVPPVPSSGWYNTDVTVTWNWSDEDSGSGLDLDNCPATSRSSSDGAAVVVSGTCRDESGNLASASVTVANVDTTPPFPMHDPGLPRFWVAPNPVTQGQPAHAGYNDTSDPIASSWRDAESGVASTACADVVTLVPGSFTVSCTATDHAGNTGTTLVPYTVIPISETIKPTISIVTPAAGAVYQRNQNVSAQFTCSDEAGGSGIASCVGTVATGSAIDTSSTGAKTLTVTATDYAGNITTSSRNYSVTAGYTFGGFAPPVDAAPIVNAGKAGKTYPVKFQLFELGVPVSDLAAVTGFTYHATSCSAFDLATANALEASVSGNTTLRYDATTSAFVYNWKTPTTPGCYALLLTLRTNQQFPAFFQLK